VWKFRTAGGVFASMIFHDRISTVEFAGPERILTVDSLLYFIRI
jgi:hypothetical protein